VQAPSAAIVPTTIRVRRRCRIRTP
jgi:hypothetical protein